MEKAHAAKAKVVVATDLLALCSLKPPGEWGADIVIGSAQVRAVLCSKSIVISIVQMSSAASQLLWVVPPALSRSSSVFGCQCDDRKHTVHPS